MADSKDTKDTAPAKSRNYLQHVVLFKVKKNASPEDVEKFLDGLRGLKAIPGVKKCEVGTVEKKSEMYDKYVDRTSGYTHVLIIRVKDLAALEAYNLHPEHVRVVKELVEKTTDGGSLAVDYYREKKCMWRCTASTAIFGFLGAAIGFAASAFVYKNLRKT